MRNKLGRALFIAGLAAILPARASAQSLETVGTRAAGLGAFVAVADDPSAIAWNPAGFLFGPLFSASLSVGRAEEDEEDAASAWRGGSTLIGIGTPPLGVGYYRLTQTVGSVTSPAVPGSVDRNSRQVVVRTLVTNHLGVSLMQSLGQYVVVAATPKLVRGSVAAASGSVASWDEAFDRAEAAEASASTRGDVDLGAMLAAGRVRAGLVVRNVTEPSFGDENGGEAVTLGRYARAGLAWGDRWPGTARTILAVDADLTRVESADGERRDVAAGAERALWGQRLAVRGGVRASTIGDPRPVVSVGASYAVRAFIYVDAFAARGGESQTAWGVAARVSY